MHLYTYLLKVHDYVKHSYDKHSFYAWNFMSIIILWLCCIMERENIHAYRSFFYVIGLSPSIDVYSLENMHWIVFKHPHDSINFTKYK